MLTLILIFMLFGFVTIPVMVKMDKKFKEKAFKEEKRVTITPFIIWMILISILASFVIGFPVVQRNIAIKDAQSVANYEQKDIFYDENKDIYFTIETDNWNLFKIINKTIVDDNIAIDIINKNSQYNELGKELSDFFGVE